MWLAVFIGVLIGWHFGGWLGAALGAAIGWVIFRIPLPMHRADLEGPFLDTAFAVMGAVCKADGRVSPAEIAIAESYFDKLALSFTNEINDQQAFSASEPASGKARECGHSRSISSERNAAGGWL